MDHLEQILEAQAVAVLVGPKAMPPWRDDDTAACLRALAGQGKPLVLVHLPGLSKRPELPDGLHGTWVDPEALLITRHLVALQPAIPETEKLLVDEVTGIRLLAIPGGTFRMGAEDLGNAKPVHKIRLSPFWLAETPVTNAQYGRFLTATGHQEPGKWRDAQFSDPQQPVVTVSWHDAQDYCRWATKASGRPYSLPSEAQWEFAARGEDSRTYPWGEEEPTPEHACYGLEWGTDKPAQVGAYPRGKGPFGTLNQAGLVLEWCLDHWDSKAYQGREDQITRDPLVETGDTEGRVLRGGCWFFRALYLRAAYRFWYPAADRGDVTGFRVAVARASP
jgi:formylglycine-generating enzyme required for sulfatase activity